MNQKSNNINNHYFSPLKIVHNKNANRSQDNLFSSSERKKKSLEKSLNFLLNTIKKTNEEEYEEIIKKRKNIYSKIDEVILLLSQNKVLNKVAVVKKNENNNFQKYLCGINKRKQNLEILKQNESLKGKNIYLKKLIKELRLKNELNNSKKIENNNNLSYDFLLRQNQELNIENKNLKEEYNIIKLDQKSNTTLEKVIDNKYEVISKMKSLKYSMNNLLNLLSNSICISEKGKINNANSSNNLLKTHTINKYDLPLKIDYLYPDQKTICSNRNNNVIFTEGGNLNTNNNSFLNDNDDYDFNTNEKSSDNEQFEISLKQFEKTKNKNINNLIINNGELNNNQLSKNHTENATTKQNQNKKIAIFTEKRKNTMTTNSYTKDLINNKMKKDFKKFFNEGKSNGENNTNYNFFNFRNIYFDKQNLFDFNKNGKNYSLINNRTSSNFKNNKKFQKNNKVLNWNFRIKNINQKKNKINNYSNDFRRMIIPSKK